MNSVALQLLLSYPTRSYWKADGNRNLLAIAMREAREESGAPFDVDIHEIPGRGSGAAHLR